MLKFFIMNWQITQGIVFGIRFSEHLFFEVHCVVIWPLTMPLWIIASIVIVYLHY